MMDALWNNTLVWRAPFWLWALVLPLVVLGLQRVFIRQQKQSYADTHLWPWVSAQSIDKTQSSYQMTRPGGFARVFHVIHFILNALVTLFTPSRLLVIAWVCFVIALAGPRSLDNQYEVSERNGIDVMFSFDVSQSMTAEDVTPNRFLLAKSLAESLMMQLENRDRVSLQVFAVMPHTVLPFTYDKAVFKQSLNLIEPGMLPTKGSWLETALIGALNRLTQSESHSNGHKVLVVFTDGAPPFWKPLELPKVVQELEVAKSQKRSYTGVKVIYVGVGKTTPATLPDRSHSSGRLHVNGLLVQSRLEESQLIKLAQQTEGVYLRASQDQSFMENLLREVTEESVHSAQDSQKSVWVYHSKPFMLMGMLALLLAFYFWQIALGSVFKVSSASMNRSVNGLGMMFLAFVLMNSFVLWPQSSHANSAINNQGDVKDSMHKAYQAFAEQSYEKAQAYYDESSNYQGWFGAGASAYKFGDLEAAVLYFRQAAWQASNEGERAQALYNLGNSYYKANLLPLAIESYQQALLYQASYPKAQHNLELAEQRHKMEMMAKKTKAQTQDKGEQEDGQNKGDNEGAFYGGQKVGESDSKEAGFGSDGDAPDGGRSGKLQNIPEANVPIDYRLNPSVAKLRLNTVSEKTPGNRVLQAQINQQRAEKFEHELQKLQDDQKALLKRLFEREEGFHAKQEKAHSVPGIQPW